jgi:hypothetical protein
VMESASPVCLGRLLPGLLLRGGALSREHLNADFCTAKSTGKRESRSLRSNWEA